MSSRYWELTVAVPPDASEGLTNFVWELGAVGVVEEETPADGARLRAFFPDAADSEAVARSVDDYLGALASLGFARAGHPAVTTVADTDWAEAWRAHFAPLPIGRRLLVAPPWETPPDADGRLGAHARARPRLRHGPARHHRRLPRAARNDRRAPPAGARDRSRHGLRPSRHRRRAARRARSPRHRLRSRRHRRRHRERSAQWARRPRDVRGRRPGGARRRAGAARPREPSRRSPSCACPLLCAARDRRRRARRGRLPGRRSRRGRRRAERARLSSRRRGIDRGLAA